MAALGIDVGTTNLKVALVDGAGHLVVSAQRALISQRPAEGAVEQDADAVWSLLVDAIQECTSAQPDVAAAVTTLGLCTQYSSIVPIDPDGVPVAPMLMWQDQRGTDRCFEILGRDENAFMTWVERHGIPTIGGGLSLAHVLYLQHDRPDIHARTAAYVEPMDYLTARLTGRITATQHSTYMFQLCDNRALGATQYDDELVKLADVDASRLPPLIRVDEPVGGIRADIAERLGIPTTTVVYAGTNDTVTGAVAGGAFTNGRAGLAIGTTSVLVDEVDGFRVDLEHQLFSMPGPYPDRYVVCAENGLGGKVLEHVLHNVVYATDELGDHGADDPFVALDDVLRATEAGAGGVMFLPWLNGSLAPGGSGDIRGGFVHMSLETSRRDLVRAVVEGVAHNLAWLRPHVDAFTGTPMEKVSFVGGAARSAPWCQVLADVIGLPVDALRAPDRAVARATALLALQRHGEIDRAIVDNAVDVDHTYDPDPERHALYAHRQEQFEAAYAALVPISEALNPK